MHSIAETKALTSKIPYKDSQQLRLVQKEHFGIMLDKEGNN